MKRKIIIIIFIVILLLAAAGVYFIFFEKDKTEEGAKYSRDIDFNIDIDVSGIGDGTKNTLENMPSTNPLERVTNPFRDAYKNPFK